MSKRRATSAGCPDCVDGLDHCHSTLVEHADGTWSCTDDDCDLGPASHGSSSRCQDLAGRCGCAEERVRRSNPRAA
ncbi:MAG TPA: hypothetical protein VFA11_18380 [Acidimicrobiales bacterium]|nr:hypothetical protein [Acidimicrobiales bacterium]